MARAGSTSGPNGGVRHLRFGPAGVEDRPPSLDARVDAREALSGGEPREVAPVLFHERAEAFPEGARLLLGERLPVDEHAEAAHDFRSARTSAAWFATSTVR